MTTPFVCHVEWGTPDPDALQKFLNQLFGWEFHAFTPEYLMYMPAEGGISVGIMKSDGMRAGGSPNASVRVNDIDAVMAKAEKSRRQGRRSQDPNGHGCVCLRCGPRWKSDRTTNDLI